MLKENLYPKTHKSSFQVSKLKVFLLSKLSKSKIMAMLLTFGALFISEYSANPALASVNLSYGALTFDAVPADPLLWDFDLNSSNSSLTPSFNRTYNNVATVNGVIVDAKITIVSQTGNTGGEAKSFDEYDNSANFSFHAAPSGSAEASVKFRMEFFDNSTGSPVVVKNIRASVGDIDKHEFARFFSPASYTLASPTQLSVARSSGNVTFNSSTTGTSATDPLRIGQVEYASASYIDFTAGCKANAQNTVGDGGSCGFTINFSSALTGLITSVVVAPTAVDDNFNTIVDTALMGNAGSNDTKPAGSTYALLTQPSNGIVIWNTDGTFTYTPASNWIGVDSFIYEITALDGTTAVATETISVLAQGTVLPVATDDSYTTPFETPLTGSAATGDTAPSGSVFSQSSQPAHGTVVWNPDGTFTYSPASGYSGTDSFTYSVTLGGVISSAIETITVQPPNSPQILTPTVNAVDDSYTTAINTAVSGVAGTGDTAPSGSVYAQTSQPAHGSVVWNADGTYVYTPNTGYTGTDSFTYSVTSGGVTDTATETITIGSSTPGTSQPVLLVRTGINSAETLLTAAGGLAAVSAGLGLVAFSLIRRRATQS